MGVELFLICTVTRFDGLRLNVTALRIMIYPACFRLTGQANGKPDLDCEFNVLKIICVGFCVAIVSLAGAVTSLEKCY